MRSKYVILSKLITKTKREEINNFQKIQEKNNNMKLNKKITDQANDVQEKDKLIRKNNNKIDKMYKLFEKIENKNDELLRINKKLNKKLKKNNNVDEGQSDNKLLKNENKYLNEKIENLKLKLSFYCKALKKIHSKSEYILENFINKNTTELSQKTIKKIRKKIVSINEHSEEFSKD